MGLEALEEEEEEIGGGGALGEESMMDWTGKHFSTNGYKNKSWICAMLKQYRLKVTGKSSIKSDTWLPSE